MKLRAVAKPPSAQTTGPHVSPEHEFEAAHGLPEPLPAGEKLLWQGSPDLRELARRAFHLRSLTIYFGALTAARVVAVLWQGGSTTDAAVAALWFAAMGAVALALVLVLAWLTARTTVYTLTDKRVVMRIGIVLSVTFNLPLRSLDAAGLKLHRDGIGDIPLTIGGSDRIAWFHLWPHARPWQVAKPQPMLRCVPDAQHLAGLLAQAWTAVRGASLAEVEAQPQATAPDVRMPRPARSATPGGLATDLLKASR